MARLVANDEHTIAVRSADRELAGREPASREPASRETSCLDAR